MKMLFAADMSFDYFTSFSGKEQAIRTMEEAAELFQRADYSMVM